MNGATPSDRALLPYLPSLARVGESAELVASLPSGQPSQVYGVAAIVLQIDALRREAWTDDVELSERLFEIFPKGFPPAPDRSAPASYKVIDDEAPARRQRCMNCVLRPGWSPCVRCQGNAVIDVDGSPGLMIRCPDCMQGFTRCTTCEGTTVSIGARVRYVNDTPVNLRRTFVPSMPKGVRAAVERSVLARESWPEILRFEPEPSMVGTAYRGANAVREPDFHGFYFGDALGNVTASIRESTRDLVGSEVRTYAVPVLWLAYEALGEEGHHAIVVQPDATLVHVP